MLTTDKLITAKVIRSPVVRSCTLVLLYCCALMLSGCTNWERKYQALNVEHQNLKGLLERERSEKGQLAEQISQEQQTRVQERTTGLLMTFAVISLSVVSISISP